jgi:hypothetical protein
MLGKAWDTKYIDNRHVIMLNNVCTLNTPKYQISVIQSSGYGKSRMVHEQAKFNWVSLFHSIFDLPLMIKVCSYFLDLFPRDLP